jgi:FkbM family methyltransferase
MHAREEFVLYIDSPREQPRSGRCRLEGWVKAMQPIEDIRLLDSAEALDRVPRPDVLLVDPGYMHVIGFQGWLKASDLRGNALRFGFSLGGNQREAVVLIKAPPEPAKGWARVRARFEMAVARSRLEAAIAYGRPISKAGSWNAEVQLLVAEAHLRRGAIVETTVGDEIIGKFAAFFPRAVVLQIGANDGVTGDHLLKWFDRTEWQMILVEPILHLVESLERRYGNQARVKIERAAVSEADGEALIYRLSERPGDPAWLQSLASLNRSILEKHRNPISDIAERIVEEVVPTLTVSSLLARHQLNQVDLIVIDTEGHDVKILRQFDLRRLRPIAIIFEHVHLSAEERKAAFSLLGRNHYRWVETEYDVYAWRNVLDADARGPRVI